MLLYQLFPDVPRGNTWAVKVYETRITVTSYERQGVGINASVKRQQCPSWLALFDMKSSVTGKLPPQTKNPVFIKPICCMFICLMQ